MLLTAVRGAAVAELRAVLSSSRHNQVEILVHNAMTILRESDILSRKYLKMTKYIR